MAIFSLALRTAASASSTATHEIIAGSANAFKLMEWGITLTTAVTLIAGAGVPLAVSTSPTSAQKLLAEDTGNTTTASTSAASAWTTPPTTPANYSRRVTLPASIGAGIIWTFPRGFTILLAKTWAVWNLNNAIMGTADVWCVVDE